ncbi:hypothetical protein GCM10011609_67640 [Lentzea pudingi]|uniref:Uncharacterized protein n=1 Tax=Lentzea pudingi TaxID=1789439 RepID=A0ABQ2IPD0_9PSEU|nr:hypothetical protein [Lentzea pudingi]GGN17289.1 hypothetical protein GCM10011609_67640 [Lentzea pudingi]
MKDFRKGATVRAHWSFSSDTEHSWVFGEILFLSDGRLLRRYGGSSYGGQPAETTWKFTEWSQMATLTGDLSVEGAARALRGWAYDLSLPGPTRIDRLTAGPVPGSPGRAVEYTSPDQLPDYTDLELDLEEDDSSDERKRPFSALKRWLRQ